MSLFKTGEAVRRRDPAGMATLLVPRVDAGTDSGPRTRTEHAEGQRNVEARAFRAIGHSEADQGPDERPEARANDGSVP